MFSRVTLALTVSLTLLTASVSFSFSSSEAKDAASIDFPKIKSDVGSSACALLISNSKSNASYDLHASASLIGQTHAITASHNFDSSRARLALSEGRLFLSCPGQPRVNVRGAILAPSYRGCSSNDSSQPDVQNDIAVILVTPTENASTLRLSASATQTAELTRANRCRFLGYSPLVCDLSKVQFPRGCDRLVNARSIAPHQGGVRSRARLDSGDSGSGLICLDGAKRAHLIGVNMAASVGRELLMFSTSTAPHHPFLKTSLGLSERDFLAQSKSSLKAHAKRCP